MRKIFLVFFIGAAILYSSETYTGLNQVVKKEVNKTFSVYAKERARGAYDLSIIRNSRSIPFLLRLLDDEIPTWCKYNGHGLWTSPAKEAREALVKIGSPSLRYIFLVLENKHPYVKLNKYNEKNLIYVLKRITGKDFKDKNDWINWWKKQSS